MSVATYPFSAWKNESRALLLILGIFLIIYFLPVETARFNGAIIESLHLVKLYAREHVLLCLVPAFFIAGAVGTFVSQGAVMKYLGAGANKVIAYGVASVSGTILAVCSCTVLPLFGGIYKRGAGLGPASAFLYSGPAINVLAIVLTARILGLQIGVARAAGAVLFSLVIGVLMAFIFRREETERSQGSLFMPQTEKSRPLWQTALFFALMTGILVFANWGKSLNETGLWHAIWSLKWTVTAVLSLALAIVLVLWYGVRWLHMLPVAGLTALAGLSMPHWPILPFTVGIIGLSVVLALTPGEAREWLNQTWEFARKILPLLLFGVLAAGFFLGTPAMDSRPAGEGIIPPGWIAGLVGGNSLIANFCASFIGAFMYFATLTEVPILQGLMKSGMGKGPGLALLLAGPALSLPSMLVIRSLIGTRKTFVFVFLVIVMSTLTGWLFGLLPS